MNKRTNRKKIERNPGKYSTHIQVSKKVDTKCIKLINLKYTTANMCVIGLYNERLNPFIITK